MTCRRAQPQALRPYLLTETEAQTVYVLLSATIERFASEATDRELIAALRLRDRFQTEETP